MILTQNGVTLTIVLTEPESYILQRSGLEEFQDRFDAWLSALSRQYHDADKDDLKSAFDSATPEIKTDVLAKLRMPSRRGP